MILDQPANIRLSIQFGKALAVTIRGDCSFRSRLGVLANRSATRDKAHIEWRLPLQFSSDDFYFPRATARNSVKYLFSFCVMRKFSFTC